MKKVLLFLLLSAPNLMQAGQLIQLPTEQELLNRFNKAALGFIENIGLAKQLGGKEIFPIEVVGIIDTWLLKYNNKNSIKIELTPEQDKNLLDCILKDFPKEIEEIKKFELYKEK
jgi:hypothetical protein